MTDTRPRGQYGKLKARYWKLAVRYADASTKARTSIGRKIDQVRNQMQLLDERALASDRRHR